MANPFEVQGINPLQALMAGMQGYDMGRKRQTEQAIQSARLEAQNALASGSDPRTALARLIGAGDLQGANAIANFGNSQRDFDFRRQEAQRAQANADRAFGLQKQQADEAARGFEYKEVDDGVGGKTLIRINRQTGKGERVNVDGTSDTPANPFMTGGKMTDAQSNAALYASRMLNAEKIFQNPAIASTGQNAWEVGKSKLPGAGTYYSWNSPEYQQFDQAKRDFVNATLRRESGAVINPDEFANAERQYFPRPGDSEAVLKQKAANRREAIKGIAAGAGRGYRPELRFDETGKVVPNLGAARGGVITKQQYDALPPGTPYTAPDGSQRVKQ